MKQKNLATGLVASFLIAFSGCATLNLDRVELDDIDSIGVKVYRGNTVVNAVIPGLDHRFETVFRIVGDDRERNDPANTGVELLTTGINTAVGPGRSLFRIPYRYALEHATVELQFQREFADAEVPEVLEWSGVYPIVWGDFVSRVYDGEDGTTPVLLLLEGTNGKNGRDVTVALAYYDAAGIESARAGRLIVVRIGATGSADAEYLLLDARARIEVYSRGGKGGTGREPTTVVPRASSGSPGTVRGDRGGRGGNGGNGGRGGAVQILAPDSELFQRVVVFASGGPGGSGGRGGQMYSKQSKVELAGTPNQYTSYSYTASGRAAQGRAGAGGRGGSRTDVIGAVGPLFENAPTWFEPGRLIDVVQ